jgi:hypothetical protein
VWGRLDLAAGYGTMGPSMSAPRWLPVLVLAAWIGLAALASGARAQVFRPRTGKGAPIAKAAPGPAGKAAAPEPTAAGSRKAAPVAAAPAKAKKTPAATSRRTVAKKKHRKPRDAEASDDDDEVTVQDDDE